MFATFTTLAKTSGTVELCLMLPKYCKIFDSPLQMPENHVWKNEQNKEKIIVPFKLKSDPLKSNSKKIAKNETPSK